MGSALEILSHSNDPGGPEVSIDPGQTVRGLAAGQRVFQRYTMKKILGRGGMGVVWLTYDEKLDRDVALKFVPEMLFLDPAAHDELKRETRKSLELTHPNIVRIYDFLEDDTAAAISMEYVDGFTLSRLRVENRPQAFEPAQIEPWLGGLCEALDYAHGVARMVHRDLKPSNLMLNGRGVVKITDFGIACSLMGSMNRISLWSSSAGTLAYMSPQQMQGETPSPLDDIYALGATLYELLTSKPPFHSGNLSVQIRDTIPESIYDRRVKLGIGGNRIPAVWERTVAACLAKNPEDRPGSAGEILQLLGLGTSAFPTPLDRTVILPGTGKPISRGPTAAKLNEPPVVKIPLHTLAIGAVAAAILLLGYALWPGKTVPPGPKGSDLAEAAPAGSAAIAGTPAAPAPPVLGGLMIKTSPPGATVALGGEAVETAPATFKAITPGKYPVKITFPGYEPQELMADIQPNAFTDLGTIALARSIGSIQITASPEGSDYELSPAAAPGDPVENTPARSGKTPDTVRDLPTGRYQLTIKHEGWPDEVKTIEVMADAVLPVEWKYPAGMLAVTTTPPGAQVYAGDRLLGTTPLSAELAPGSYSDINVTLDGFVPVTMNATVEQGTTTTLDPITVQELVTALQLTTDPAGLTYTISDANGVPIRDGQTPAAIFDIPPGTYSVVFKRPGWPDFTAAATLEAKKPISIEHDFPEGTATVTSTPVGAEILLGETSLGVTPLTVTLPPGR